MGPFSLKYDVNNFMIGFFFIPNISAWEKLDEHTNWATFQIMSDMKEKISCANAKPSSIFGFGNDWSCLMVKLCSLWWWPATLSFISYSVLESASSIHILVPSFSFCAAWEEQCWNFLESWEKLEVLTQHAILIPNSWAKIRALFVYPMVEKK